MQIDVSQIQDIVVIKPSGSMDATTTNIFVNACQESLDAGAVKILIDLAGIEYMSSAGLRGVLTLLKGSRAKKVPVAFCNLQPMVSEVFKISGFTAMMPIYDTPETALAKL